MAQRKIKGTRRQSAEILVERPTRFRITLGQNWHAYAIYLQDCPQASSSQKYHRLYCFLISLEHQKLTVAKAGSTCIEKKVSLNTSM